MAQLQDVVKTISSLKNVAVSEDVPVEIMRKTSQQVSELLTSDVAVNFLKRNPKEYHHLEVVLPIYVRVIFHPDKDVAGRCFIHRDLFLDIFQSKLPGIKKEAWYKEFEVKSLANLISTLESRVVADDESWVPIWIFATKLVVNCSIQTPPLNKLLLMTEYAFKKGKENIAILDKAWACWVALINAFERFPEILTPSRILMLLLKPLKICLTVSKRRISTWVHLIKVMGPQNSSPDSVKSLVHPFIHAMYEPLERALSRHYPDECAEALVEIASLNHVVETCLPELVGIFGACVNSKPSGGLIEMFASALVKAINDMPDDGKSFKLWQALLDQYNHCTESPILTQASRVIFSGVNFLRWADSGTVGSNEISELMRSCEFRNEVLLRSVRALKFEDQDNTPTKKKSRKGVCEIVWSNYCEAFISWWSTQGPPKESDMTEGHQQGCDYTTVKLLLLKPIEYNMWNQAISKTWARLCEACHTQKLLHNHVNAIFDAVDEPNFNVQVAVCVSDCLFKIDNSFCVNIKSIHLFETISSAIKSMEFQSLLDVLNLLEVAVLYPETASIIGKICKIANEKSCDYDQLNTHKIRTKVGKIMRKLDNTSSAEKEKPTRAQRTPFRTQSNFQQRLAKAAEKNRTKSPFLTSILSSADKTMNCIEDGDGQLDDSVLSISTDSGVSPDDARKEDSEIVPVITLPSVLISTPVKENDVNEGMVAEKENVIVPTVTASPQPSSPRLKITNAREVKTIDSSSPSVPKKLKPMAGQKSTPKKVTPSKVSYFDDDANDCIMVPPKPKTTLLTEHQMEVMSKRRTDIPALYQDLSQDTQTSQPPAVIEEVTTGVSPQPIQPTQDIVPGTPSPEDRGVAIAQDHQKSSGKSSSSAKKLDFNGFQTPPSKVTPLSSSFRKMSPVPEQFNCDGEQNSRNGTGLVNSVGNEVPERAVVGLADSDKQQNDLKIQADITEAEPVGTEKSRKKRKSEPTKFSPKLTRSKKSLKSATPDAKMSITLPVSELKSSPLQSPGPKVKSPREHGTNDHNPARELIEPKSREPTNSSQAAINICQAGNPPSPTQKGDELFEVKLSPQGDKIKYGGSQENEDQPCQRDDEILPSSQTTPKASEPMSLGKTKKSRKRKADESSLDDSKKNPEEDGPITKKSNSSKKKKPFKLGAGGNLENWLVKKDRVPSLVTETEVKIARIEKESSDTVISPSKCSMEVVPEDTVVDLNNSEEIVPSTQELGKDHCEVQLNSEADGDELIKEDVTAPRTDLILDKNQSPAKPEESVLERLAHESPNDDIDLIISPSKRNRRAPSVFRGEGDTYLLKDEMTTPEAPDEESKSPIRSKNKTASPKYRKKLQPAGGRSAKMLRLATGTTSLEENLCVVIPLRRRESIAPVKYGENWPKGHMEDWVARTPSSPCASPYRSALKKTPGNEENVTPKRSHDSLASPLLSSAKRRRVVFLDPPVTRGLIYEVGSPGGSLHHADVPQGSPYPTWKGDDDKSDMSPSKRDTERLNSLDLKPIATGSKEESQEASSLTRDHSGKPEPDLKAPSDVSDEVRRLVDPPEPTTTIGPSPEPDMDHFKEKYHLSDDFMTGLSDLDAHIRSLLIQCFKCDNMAETVDSWKFGDCRQVCQIPHSFLKSVKNSMGETLTEILSSAIFPAPTNKVPPVLMESSAQTDQPKFNSTQTNTPEPKNAISQTTAVKTKSIKTNTEATAMKSASTQADLTLPSVEDLSPLLKKVGTKEALLFFSDSMRILSSLSREN